MQPLRAFFHRIKSPYLFAFGVLFFMPNGILASSASGRELGNAQDSAPQQTPGPQYHTAIFRKAISSDQLVFLNNFAGAASNVIFKDKQYRKLIGAVVPDCLFHIGHDMTLFDALETVLKGPPLPVQIRDGRYVMVSSGAPPNGAGRGFMWIDMQDGIALGGIFFRPSNGEPTPTLTIFSRQVKEKFLEMRQLPAAFAEDLHLWSGPAQIPPVETRYFINGSNEKIVLQHDEDYCAPTNGSPAPPQNVCEQMNEAAADVDLDAAYYVEQTDHAPNATARMINGADQIEWIQLRENTCRVGPDPLGCHIRMTRDRTHVVISRHSMPHSPRR
jgi:hypothetical protein